MSGVDSLQESLGTVQNRANQVDPSIISLAERPDLLPAFRDESLQAAWPPFMLQDPLAHLIYAPGRIERFFDFSLVAVESDRPEVVLGRAVSVPFCLGAEFGRPDLPTGGWDTAVRWADQDLFLGRTPNAVCALEILVHPSYAGQGLSGRLLDAVRVSSARLGFGALYVPVRPSQKHLHPHVPMADYVQRMRDDGLPSDAWLRIHVRAGGRVVGVANHSMTIAGTLDDWRSWTGMPFEESGAIEVPGALGPVHVSVEQNYAVYVEPNVWVCHKI